MFWRKRDINDEIDRAWKDAIKGRVVQCDCDDLTSRTTRIEPNEQAKAHLKASVEALKQAYVENLADSREAEAESNAAMAQIISTSAPRDQDQAPSPVAELCADIVAHPGEYERADDRIISKRDNQLWIDPNRWMSSFFDPGKIAGRQRCHSPEERNMMENAARAHDDYLAKKREADLAARLAKVKAEREAKPSGLSCDVQQYSIACCSKIDNPHTQITAGIARRMLPVLEGTHKIVPVDKFVVTDEEMQKAINAAVAGIVAGLSDAVDEPTTIKGPTWTIEAPVERTVTAYMCANAWEHDLGNAPEVLYPSVEELRDGEPCTDECGSVEVEVRLKRHIASVTVETHTPGGDRTAMRDFLTDKGPNRPRARWTDLDGKPHHTRSATRAANVAIKRRRAKNGPPPPPPEAPMRKGA